MKGEQHVIRIEDSNWENNTTTKAYLTEVCRSLTEYLDGGGKSIKIGIIKGTDLKTVASSLREIAEMFEAADAIMSRAIDDDDDDDDDDEPFARPTDPDDFDPADFWKPKRK